MIAAPVAFSFKGRYGVSVGISTASFPTAPGAPSGQRMIGVCAGLVRFVNDAVPVWGFQLSAPDRTLCTEIVFASGSLNCLAHLTRSFGLAPGPVLANSA